MSPRFNLPTAPVLFGVFVLLGVAFIIMAKVQFALSPAVALSVPVGIMLGYAAIVNVPALRLRDDQTGDNLYYMGFLYTLTSLGVALYQFSAEGSAEQIVQAFGIAIASTIAGIALRVLFAQMRKDPVEVERHARLELAEAARRVRRELDATVIEFSSFRRHTTQALDDGFADISRKVDEISESLLKAVAETVEKSRGPIIDAAKASSELLGTMGQSTAEKLDRFATQMTSSLDNSASKLAAENNRLSTSIAAMAHGIDGMSQKLLDMQTPEKVIEVKLEPVLRPIIKGAADFARNAERAAESHAQQLVKADAIQTNLAALAGSIQEISARLAQSERSNEFSAEAIKELTASFSHGFSKAQASFQASRSDMERLLAAIDRNTRSTAISFTNASNAQREPDLVGATIQMADGSTR